MQSVTTLLEATRAGDKAAEHALFGMLYQDLRALARKHLAGRAPRHLQTTSLIHETYLRLAGENGLPHRDRAHLFAVASTAMRQIAIDHARAALTHKRGAGQGAATLDPDRMHATPLVDHPEHLLALEQALTQLESVSARMSKLVELRFFGGFELEEIGELLGVTARTLKRDWRVARAILYEVMDESGP
jgi:RNA polymerase sigma factor (TIGR02999 family)